MPFSKSLQGNKSAIITHPVSIESTLLLFLFIQSFLALNFIMYILIILTCSESVGQRCSVKNVFLKISQNSQENTCDRVSLLLKLQSSACNFIKKETLAQVFSCQFSEIFKELLFLQNNSGGCFYILFKNKRNQTIGFLKLRFL